MSPTAKILLGVGAAGGAGYLLWRLWPKEEPVYYTPPPPPGVPMIPDYVPTAPSAVYVPPARMQASVLTCPPGTFQDASGACVPFQVD